MKRIINPNACALTLLLGFLLSGCQSSESEQSNRSKVSATRLTELTSLTTARDNAARMGKPVIYQVFTRLYGNQQAPTQAWGTIEQNGVGKFNDFTRADLLAIRELGVTHIWYTGVLHHAVINDYPEINLTADDPDVVKGRAGSPYAIKDYYNVNPDLATDPSQRMEEFVALIERTHAAGLKVMIDIVPNHVARNYHSTSKPVGHRDFGADDNTAVAYHRDNDFYYIPQQAFQVPNKDAKYQPLGGHAHPLADGKFAEYPAKWTGNGSRLAQPDQNDWYETVKINYGIRPDGTKDFVTLPPKYATLDTLQHYQFWQQQKVPAAWLKFRQITEFWLSKGVDGFRFDVAELVPVEFWSYLNSHIKQINPEALLLAEIYQPSLYRDFIHLGKMDYLYDKVDFYDTMKAVMQNRAAASDLITIQKRYQDIRGHLLHFLENHDEQRIASPEFAGDATIAKPAMVVSATISESPTLIYFAQELGEPASDDPGFGDPSRTTIFDYWAVPSLQRFRSNGTFDGALLTTKEKQLRSFYQELLNLTVNHAVFRGDYASLHEFNLTQSPGYSERVLAFTRFDADNKVIVVSNFDSEQSFSFTLQIPEKILQHWQLQGDEYRLIDLLSGEKNKKLRLNNQIGRIQVDLQPLQSYIFQLSE
ncbi:MAG: alpha-amylase [Gammaproteobacteria bacterium]|nr:alpha-amylase [Gammaproteobacteria bacterium]